MPEGPGPTWAEFAEGWTLGLYRDPVLVGVFAGLVLGYIGVFVVLRRMVFVTAAVSQAAGLGVALAFYLGIHHGLEVEPLAGAIAVALVAILVFTLPAERLRLSSESLLGFAYLAAWSLAVLVGDRITQEAHDIASILFGTAVLVRGEDLVLVGALGAFVLLMHVWWHRGLTFAAFDPDGARVQGLPVRLLDVAQWVLVALAVSVTTRALGVLPVFALAVLPPMAALMLFDRLRWALPVAALLGALSGGLGYLAAFFFEFPVGASQATVAALAFLACLPARLLRSRS